MIEFQPFNLCHTEIKLSMHSVCGQLPTKQDERMKRVIYVQVVKGESWKRETSTCTLYTHPSVME